MVKFSLCLCRGSYCECAALLGSWWSSPDCLHIKFQLVCLWCTALRVKELFHTTLLWELWALWPLLLLLQLQSSRLFLGIIIDIFLLRSLNMSWYCCCCSLQKQSHIKWRNASFGDQTNGNHRDQWWWDWQWRGTDSWSDSITSITSIITSKTTTIAGCLQKQRPRAGSCPGWPGQGHREASAEHRAGDHQACGERHVEAGLRNC